MQELPTKDRVSHQRDVAHCKKMIEHGSKTFHMASLLLPKSVGDPACILYAFCRLSDDEVDVSGRGHSAITSLRHRLDLIYQGAPLAQPEDRALAQVVTSYQLPQELPEALIEGLEWDAQGRRYETIEELFDYAARVAGAVGAMMSVLMGSREPSMIARACDLGVAMQLTNIARDVGEDARAGRLYLPRSWMKEEGLDPDRWLEAPTHSPALGRVIERLLNTADGLYQKSEAGISRLPRVCRPSIFAARFLYAEIGNELRRLGLSSVTTRAVVSRSRKLVLLARSLREVLVPKKADVSPPLRQTSFLVEAVRPAAGPDQPSYSDRLLWVLDLFIRLEQDERRRYADRTT